MIRQLLLHQRAHLLARALIDALSDMYRYKRTIIWNSLLCSVQVCERHRLLVHGDCSLQSV